MNDRPSRNPRTLSERLRIGTFQATKIGAARFDWRDPYHLALTLPWPGFLLSVLAVYLVHLSLLCIFAGYIVDGIVGEVFKIFSTAMVCSKPVEFFRAICWLLAVNTLATSAEIALVGVGCGRAM